jgi:hypothetical protein
MKDWTGPWRLSHEPDGRYIYTMWRRLYEEDCSCHPCILSGQPLRVTRGAAVFVDCEDTYMKKK